MPRFRLRPHLLHPLPCSNRSSRHRKQASNPRFLLCRTNWGQRKEWWMAQAGNRGPLGRTKPRNQRRPLAATHKYVDARSRRKQPCCQLRKRPFADLIRSAEIGTWGHCARSTAHTELSVFSEQARSRVGFHCNLTASGKFPWPSRTPFVAIFPSGFPSRRRQRVKRRIVHRPHYHQRARACCPVNKGGRRRFTAVSFAR